MHPEFAPIAIIAALSLALPLPWHWRARNVATLSIIAWLFVTNIIFAVDAIIWADSIDIVALVWCDITSKLIVGGNFALPAACLCICIHLEQVSSVRTVRVTPTDKKRRQIFEACMCFGLPILFMALHYVVQGHRFDIIQGYGCRPTTYISIPAIFIVWIPPLLMALASLVFAGLALRHFIQRRITFAAHLDATHSALTTSRYLRLMLMSVLQMVWSISLTIFTLWFTTISIPIRPWTTWADVHSNFSRVDTYPTLFTPQLILSCYYALWWTVPASTFIFVAFFAFGNEAVAEYKKALLWVRCAVLRLPPPAPSASSSSYSSAYPGAAAAGKPNTKFAGGISLASFDAKPASPAHAKFLEAQRQRDADMDPEFDETETRTEAGTETETDARSLASSSGPALSYHPQLPTPAPSPASPPARTRTLTPPAPRPYTYPSSDYPGTGWAV